ncbi:MAG: uroporphyrinogen-III C-methyltransferase [Rudaea sp.]
MDEISTTAADTGPRRRRTPFVLGVLLLAAIAAAIWWWRFAPPRADTAAEIATLRTQVDGLSHALTQLRGNADTLRARLDDGDKVDASVRQQLLGLGDRLRMAEDAVANLSDQRLTGHDALALDEAELLLTLGVERYTLFHDTAATVAAYRLADTALAEVDDAAFSTVRQSIAGEIAALQDSPSADSRTLTASLAHLRAQVPHLPQAGSLAMPAPTSPSQQSLWARWFGTLVQVRHDEGRVQAQAATRDAALARDLIVLDVQAAQAAALARDDAGFRAALDEARTQITAAFDTRAPQTAAALAQLDALAKAALAPAPPAVLGMALKELRNLRATHALSAARPALPPLKVKK